MSVTCDCCASTMLSVYLKGIWDVGDVGYLPRAHEHQKFFSEDFSILPYTCRQSIYMHTLIYIYIYIYIHDMYEVFVFILYVYILLFVLTLRAHKYKTYLHTDRQTDRQTDKEKEFQE
jgi:hypothetical protein